MSTIVEGRSDAFNDEYTKALGSTFLILVEPIFDEQITEAATFIAKIKPEASRVEFISQFTTKALIASPPSVEPSVHSSQSESEEVVEVVKIPSTPEQIQLQQELVKELFESVVGCNLVGADGEFEGFYNLMISLLLSSYAIDSTEFSNLLIGILPSLAQNSIRSLNPSNSTRYVCLTSIFNILPLQSAHDLKLLILLKLVDYATSNEDYTIIKPILLQFESLLHSWGYSYGSAGQEEGNAATLALVKSLSGKKSEARVLLLNHLSTPSSVPSEPKTASASVGKLATKLISLTLAQPDYFDFTPLLSLPSISAAEPELVTLLQLFTSTSISLDSLASFTSANPKLCKENDLDETSLKRKLQLLVLAGACEIRVGESISYEEIGKALGLGLKPEDDGEEVEVWVIDAIRAKLISGKLSQSLKTFSITRAVARNFGMSHWEALEKKLRGWQTGLAEVRKSVAEGIAV